MSNKNPNLKNLKAVHSTMDAKERGRKGGIKSGESQRRKKSMAEELRFILDQKDSKTGLPWRQIICEGLCRGAANGNTKAFDRIMYMIGETIKIERENLANNEIEVVLSPETEKYAK